MIARFRSPLQFEDDGGFPLTLLCPLVYDCADLNRSITVPTGFKTDLASVPRVLWNLLPPVGRYDAAATVHDFLYQHNGVTRHEADRVLHEAMCVLGVGWWTRWAIYSGVVVGGWVVWNRYRAAEAVPV